MSQVRTLRLFVSSSLRLFCVLCGCLFCGCQKGDAERAVVVYTSVDEPYAGPIVREFEKRTGVHVRLVTDSEASKSVGLAERLRAEKANPQADVWWSNEPFHTINLAEEGLLEAYESPSAKDIAAMYRDPGHRWAGNGLRARVIAVREGAAKPKGLEEFGNSKRAAMARPTAGTTGGHVAALYVAWGETRADAFFRNLQANGIKLLGGNGPVAEAVGGGEFDYGLTDNDDVTSTQREGGKLLAVLPDQDGIGTLMLPTTVGIVSGTRQQEAARRLVDYLLSAEVEQKLIEAHFAGWSVRGGGNMKAMELDYREAARMMPDAVRRATAILEGRQGQ